MEGIPASSEEDERATFIQIVLEVRWHRRRRRESLSVKHASCSTFEVRVAWTEEKCFSKYFWEIRLADQEPDSEEKNGPENGPQNGPEMQFLFSDIYQLPKWSWDLSPDLSFRNEKGISVQKICSIFYYARDKSGDLFGDHFRDYFQDHFFPSESGSRAPLYSPPL